MTPELHRAALAWRWLNDGERVAREFMAQCSCPPGLIHIFCRVHVPLRLDVN